MTNKQETFCDEYLIDLNATQAAIRAGYSPKTAKEQGSRLLSKANIRARIDKEMAERSKRTGINADRVLRELARVAFVNPTDVIDIDEAVIRECAMVDDTAAIQSVKCKTTMYSNDKESKETVEREIRLHDKIKALDLLMRHLDMFPRDKKQAEDADEEHTGVVVLPQMMEAPTPPETSDDEGVDSG